VDWAPEASGAEVEHEQEALEAKEKRLGSQTAKNAEL
jgi:hypothetical protein